MSVENKQTEQRTIADVVNETLTLLAQWKEKAGAESEIKSRIEDLEVDIRADANLLYTLPSTARDNILGRASNLNKRLKDGHSSITLGNDTVAMVGAVVMFAQELREACLRRSFGRRRVQL